MKTFLTIAMSLVFATAAVHATIYINQDYDGLIPPASPGVPAVAVRTGTGAVTSTATNIVTGGSSGVAVWMNKTTNVSAFLEYNAGAAALSNMYVSFDVANNAPSATITQQMTFGVGAWNSSTGSSVLNASANRNFAMDFYQGLRNDMTLRGAGNFSLTTGVAYAANYQNVKIWANDNDTTAISYIRPDTSALASLGPNSVVFWLNNALIFDETDSGYVYTNSANGNATLGRLGFTVTSGNQANFLIDNLLVTDVVVPEPSTFALVGFAGLMLVWARRRHAK